ncbi:MAG: hypothetical protein GY749_40840 [Desulfobacteraceae bacterium]|nr:hypothetical protein [Desulfobacteraceae bacterium]
MENRNSQKIQDAIGIIESEVQDTIGKVRFDVYGGALDESIIRANSAGLIRMGIIFLKVGFASDKIVNSENSYDLAIRDLTHEDSEIKFRWIDRAEDVDQPSSIVQDTRQLRKRITWGDKIFFWISVLIAVFFISIMIIPTLANWLA